MSNPAKLISAAKALLKAAGLRSNVGETPYLATLARGIVDKAGNVTINAETKTITGYTESKMLKKGVVTTYTGATDAIDISLGDIFILNRTGAVDAATLADPAAADEGRVIWIKNGAAQANTITITSGLGGSGAAYGAHVGFGMQSIYGVDERRQCRRVREYRESAYRSGRDRQRGAGASRNR
ncbi:MAG: hypothetical protein ABJF10_21285 [Chthoniobacter sp.]|uniref:hypothetical protein n=1 Tax=Chthoniobacter sp. TaxID=2510640 RepID=UPI0032A7A199